jgi:uncharacterized protein YfaS (alpha-2-macroglobulin family)
MVLLACLAATWTLAAGPRDAQWKKVDDAVNKGLPKTAIEQLQPIIEAALRDRAYPEAIKAIAKKIALEGNIQGNKPEEKITRLQAEIAKAPKEMVPVMDAILANWYWHYFQQNRWRFLQRTATGEAPGADFTTWDLPRLFAEIDKQFTKALAAEATLKATAIASYNDLLEKGTMPDRYRPTLFDFLAHEALAFYTSGEQAAAKAEDAFELTASSPIFGSVDDFLKWTVETTDAESPTVKAIKLYQNLMKFHQNDKDRSAFVDVDLDRLQFGFNKAFGEEKNARYKAALAKFADAWGDHEISARARFLEAGVLQQEGELVKAHKLAQQGAKAFPESIGGKQCFNLVQQIESKSSIITTERVWNNPWPVIQIRYKNLTRVYFRAVRSDWVERLNGRGRYRPEQLTIPDRRDLLAKKPEREWAVNLPATDDFQERTEDLAAPKDLPPGFYFLIASHDPGFGDNNNHVTFADFWVSDLALVIRNRPGADRVEGFVLEAGSGEPIEGAQVQIWFRENNNAVVTGPKVQTDKNGLFTAQTRANRNCLMSVAYKGRGLAAANDFYSYLNPYRPQPSTQTMFFTDRSLYRPGQTVHYKGICIAFDQDKDDYHVVTGRDVMVIFSDPNGKEIARQQQRVNDYGSFAGSFTAPRDRLMGRMTIRSEAEPQGMTQVSVEEYKRPKFQVTLDAPKVAAKLNAAVDLQGKATAYTGAAVGGAKVRFRVVRQVLYPIWWQWYYWWRTPRTDSQEITHGTAETANDGTFKISFVAKPDATVAEKDEPTFHYSIHADVTDTTGETRSAERTVNVGYTALKAILAADDWQTADKEVKLTISTQSLDDEGQAAKGTLKVYRLREPDKVQRAALVGYQPRFRGGKVVEPKPDPSNPNSWALGDVAAEQQVTTDAAGKAAATVKLPMGIYRAILETQDRFGKPVTARLPVQVLKPKAGKLGLKVPNLVAAPSWKLEPGQEFLALWGTGYDQARAFIEIEHRQKLLQAFWTEAGLTQAAVKMAVTEAQRGGFTLRVTMVRENRAYITMHKVDVPWTNKDLTVKWEHFVSKLEPARKETWTAVITGPNARKAVAEMVATLYDQSLDAYLPHPWPRQFNVFRQDFATMQVHFENMLKQFQHLHGNWPVAYKDARYTYRAYPNDLTVNLWGYMYFRNGRGGGFGGAPMAPGAAPEAATMLGAEPKGQALRGMQNADGALGDRAAKRADALDKGGEQIGAVQQGGPNPVPDLGSISARKNLNETAFFFPHLISDQDGQVKLEFTMPEALTQWRFMGFAHDRDLRSGYLEDKVVTAKDIMVQPNAPRFVREGDAIDFTVKVSNQSPTRQTGQVRLTLADARTGQSVDGALGNGTIDLPFDIAAGQSHSYAWRLQIPDGLGPLSYKAVGSSGRLSDGEEGFLPVLSRRMLVTESIALPIRGPGTKEFDFTKLEKSGQSATLKNETLTVQMTSNPSWYAVLALPYLMEFPHECTEQTFNRLYANALARHIAGSDPKIRRIFDQWKGTGALDSPLEKNQDLKAVMLEETPWLRQAVKESQARKNVGILFDENRLNTETAALLSRLAELQLGDGAWPWFPGGPANDYITLYITTGFGRMRHLGVKLDAAPAIKSLARLDNWISEIYTRILNHGKKEDNHLSSTIALYLYGRSFFLADKPIDGQHKPAVDYFLGQARKYWLKLANRQSQAHLAIALKRFDDKETATGIMRSIKERSVSDEELGMFWRDTELSFFWFHAPIETQAMMIEAFDEVMGDKTAVEDCKVWLLKQKQTQDWKTTKATADAVYALLLRGTSQLASDALVQVSLGGDKVEPDKVEAGTGFYEQRFLRKEIKPEQGHVTVKKLDAGVAWGSLHWQYLEDIAKITAHEGTPLKLTKSLYTRENTKKGPVLKPVNGALSVGDEVVVRIVLKTDRDMEYIHMKDQRGSGTEPVNVLSRYRYQDGLAYYESTRDTASHFFIDYLPKGTYVFEYAVRVVHKGQYQTGMANIQCMYAPEFNSHSESIGMEVK